MQIRKEVFASSERNKRGTTVRLESLSPVMFDSSRRQKSDIRKVGVVATRVSRMIGDIYGL
jgi:hypothetical protein